MENEEYIYALENERDLLKQKVSDLEEVLRSLASYVGAGGYNAPEVDPRAFEEKIRWGIDALI